MIFVSVPREQWSQERRYIQVLMVGEKYENGSLKSNLYANICHVILRKQVMPINFYLSVGLVIMCASDILSFSL